MGSPTIPTVSASAAPSQPKPSTGGSAAADGFPWRVLLVSSLSAINNMAFGYDVGVVSGSLADMATSLALTTFEKEAATSGLNFVAGFGGLYFAGNALDYLGRRATLMVASVLLLLGCAVVVFAQSFAVLLLGRALQGLGSGCAWCACSVYITEVAPSQYRGALVAISDIAINVGILVGYAADRAINVSIDNADTRWRVAMAISAAFPAVYMLLYPWMPDTPRWLVMVGREEQASRTQKWLANVDDDVAAEHVGAIAASVRGLRQVRWIDLADRRVASRWLLFVTLFLGLGQQLTGTEAILYYVPSIINECPEAGLPQPAGCVARSSTFLINMGVGTCKLVGELLAAFIVERAGRRTTLAASNLLVSVLVFTIALKFLLGWSTAAGALSLCLVMFFFSLGPGPLTWVVVNEMVPLRLRGKLVALSVFFNRLGSGTIALTFLSLKEWVGAFAAFTLYALLGAVVTAFYWWCVPDLTGKSLEEAESPNDARPSQQPSLEDRSLLVLAAGPPPGTSPAPADDAATRGEPL